jgi:hypothetical protein
LTDAVVKVGTCEGCNSQYAYTHEVTAHGTGLNFLFVEGASAERRAARKANQELAARLEYDCTPVPCPQCSFYQTNMVEKIRRGRWRLLQIMGYVLIPLSVFVLVVALTFSLVPGMPQSIVAASWFCGVSLLLVGFGLLIFRTMSNRKLDPNCFDGTEERFELARKYAMDSAAVKRMLQRQNIRH